jgi:predicted acylesterase/phospholipase RssA
MAIPGFFSAVEWEGRLLVDGGVARNLPVDVVRKMGAEELASRERASKEKLAMESGAHYVIDDLRDLPAVIADINRRLAAGENP